AQSLNPEVHLTNTGFLEQMTVTYQKDEEVSSFTGVRCQRVHTHTHTHTHTNTHTHKHTTTTTQHTHNHTHTRHTPHTHTHAHAPGVAVNVSSGFSHPGLALLQDPPGAVGSL